MFIRMWILCCLAIIITLIHPVDRDSLLFINHDVGMRLVLWQQWCSHVVISPRVSNLQYPRRNIVYKVTRRSRE